MQRPFRQQPSRTTRNISTRNSKVSEAVDQGDNRQNQPPGRSRRPQDSHGAADDRNALVATGVIQEVDSRTRTAVGICPIEALPLPRLVVVVDQLVLEEGEEDLGQEERGEDVPEA